MDQLTKEFFNNSFPGFNHQSTLADHVLANNVPVVEIDLGIDFPRLLPVEVCETLSIPDINRTTHPYEFEPRIVKWGLEILWSNGAVAPVLKDFYYKKMSDPIPYRDTLAQAIPVRQALTDAGFDVSLCWISKFAPGGYVRPHRDISLRQHPLTYFWIPINNPAGCEFKTYPYGTIKVNLGSMYLFNQENFTHSVCNLSDQSRYAILGYFNPNIPLALTDKILHSIKEQYKTI